MLLILLFLAATALQDGLIAMRGGRYAEAKVKLEKATELEPENAVAWVSLAESCRRTNEMDEANKAAQRAVQFGSGQPPVEHALAMFYAAQGSFRDAAQWEEKYALSAKQDGQAMARAGDLYLQAGALPDAERTLKIAWQAQPSDPVISFEYAKLLLQKLDFVEAANAVSAARKADPKDPQLILVSGVANYGERRFPEAVNDFLAVIKIDAGIAQPYQFLSKMLEHAGDRLPELTAAFQRRVHQAPDDPLPYLVLAKAKLAANAKDPEAETLLRHSLSLDGANWESHYELGAVLENKHEFETAAAELTKAISLDGKQPMPHYHLARVYDRLGKSEDAAAERKRHQDLISGQN